MAKFNDPKIYLKDSDKARLADIRIRIVKETDPREPCDNEDLVFRKVEDEHLIPANALYKWKFDFNYEHEPIWFYTTAERCKEMVSEDPSYWTLPKLKEFAEIEHRLYQDWYDGHVYGYIIEKWDEKQRKWMTTSSLWGIYGAKDLFYNLAAETDGVNIPICIDSEEMKYDFDNVEKQPIAFGLVMKQHFDKPFPLYHLSEVNYDGQTFEPRPMDKDRVMEGENWKTKRICVSKSIDGAVSALCDSIFLPYGLQLYVHIPTNLEKLFKEDKVYKPSVKQVPDADVTDEHWIKCKTTFKCIGKIEVGHIDDSYDLWYEWDGDQTKMDRFHWRWIEKIT